MGNRILMTLVSIFIGLYLCYLGDCATDNCCNGLSVGFYISSGIIGFGGPLAAVCDFLNKLPKNN
jgi:hypothetical protein